MSRTPLVQKPLKTLRMSEREFAALLESVKPAPFSRRDISSERRATSRHPVGQSLQLFCQIHTHDQQSVQFVVRSHDISVEGVGFLHGGYVHCGLPCTLIMITADRRGFRTSGHIRQCRHVQKQVHRVGVQFDRPLDLNALGVAENPDTEMPLFDGVQHAAGLPNG